MNKKNLETISYKVNDTGHTATCEITYDPISSSIEKKLNPVEMQRYLRLLQCAQNLSKEHYAEIEELHKKYPQIPEITNLLTFVLLQKKEFPKAEKLIEENYVNNPDYFFARINYADQCLRQKKTDAIAQIFPSFSLPELFPKRKVFHFTEFRGFMVLMGFYHLAIGKKERAKEFYQAAMQADPAHISVIALEKKLIKPSLLKRIKKVFNFRRLLQKRSSSARR